MNEKKCINYEDFPLILQNVVNFGPQNLVVSFDPPCEGFRVLFIHTEVTKHNSTKLTICSCVSDIYKKLSCRKETV